MRKKLSCHIITYNQKDYISKCIDGVLMQKVNFSMEIVIGDDKSTDGTREILMEYVNKYPDLIKLNLRDARGEGILGKQNFISTLEMCEGEYISLCDGDDYWTDPSKLQKQVDFLEANPDYVMCTHVAEEKNEVTNSSSFFPSINQNTTKQIEDYIINNLTATCSLMFKIEYLKPIPKWFKKIHFGDLGLMLLIFYRSNKKMMVLKDSMSVYRVNSGSIHGSLKNNNASLIKAYKMHLDFIDTIDNELFLKSNFEKVVVRKKINTHSILADLYKNSSVTNYYKHLFKKFLLTRFKC
ncbi:glycosyltransferase [Flavobacterium sp. WC2509]|uniref:glycosyltransferase n=1 Tax=Flavobacterium sp. WC2509 TaxID=3461406 RepID=UPI0040443297